jgi:hypothetical protein
MKHLKLLALLFTVFVLSCSDDKNDTTPPMSKTTLLTADYKKEWHLQSIGSSPATETTIYTFYKDGGLTQKVGSDVNICDWKWVNNESGINITYRVHPTTFDAPIVKLTQDELLITISGENYNFKKH